MPRPRPRPIIYNGPSRNHRHPLKQAIRASDDIFLAVAFLKQSGLSQIIADFREVLQRGATLTAVIGTDFWLTDPEALEVLFRLQSECPSCKLHIFKSSPKSTFHPKYYRFKTGKTMRMILGSANLTDGGLATNIEVNLLF
jgi:HKD family nuclease